VVIIHKYPIYSITYLYNNCFESDLISCVQTVDTSVFFPLWKVIHKSYPLMHRFALAGQAARQQPTVFGQLRVLAHQFLDLAAGVHHCGVIATTEGLADIRQTQVGQFLAQ